MTNVGIKCNIFTQDVQGENMEICKSCDHNVIIECSGGCFFPHNTPPCFRSAMDSQTTVVQQLKAEIEAKISELTQSQKNIDAIQVIKEINAIVNGCGDNITKVLKIKDILIRFLGKI